MIFQVRPALSILPSHYLTGALEKRGYILTYSVGATEHHRSELMVYIRLTTEGRKLVRQALDIHRPARLPVGALREWHWKALVYAYKAGEQGVREWPKGIGQRTVRRLKEYQVKGQDSPLMSWVEIPCEPYIQIRWPGDSGYTATTRHVLCITSFGLQYYQENWQWYRELYPAVDAPDPQKERKQGE